jgi:glucuronate isomerase
LFPLNPADAAPIATLAGAFVEAGVPGKVQLGPAWWYNDHRSGIRQHLDAVASLGVLGCFIGMTSDSRSLLSSVRHEYFRRVLCAMIGEWVDRGELPGGDDTQAATDAPWLGRLIADVCHDNAARWLQPNKETKSDG